MSVVHLTKADFLTKVHNYEVSDTWKYLGDKPAILDFYAPWCGPCKMLSPILDQIAEEYDGQIYVYKVNVDEEEELSSIFDIQTVPSVFFIPVNGNPQVARGALPKNTIKEAIQEVLLK